MEVAIEELARVSSYALAFDVIADEVRANVSKI